MAILCYISLLLLNLSCDTPEKIEEKITTPHLQKILDLPAECAETSGAIVYDSLLWTFNDSGNDPVLFGISFESGEIISVVTLTNAENTDWEDIAQDETSIYIGDFGNNYGDRQDLVIYKIAKGDMDGSETQNVSCEEIAFHYADQTDFEAEYNATSFDCEAMFILNSEIYILNKDWINETCTLYILQEGTEDFVAQKVTDLPVEGLVSGADIHQSKTKLVVCGYRQYIPFIVQLNIDDSENLTASFDFRVDFPDQIGNQIEGVFYMGDQIMLTNENKVVPQALWQFKP